MEQATFTPIRQSEAIGTFKVLVLYEDFATGVRGKQIADFVLDELGTNAEPETVLWNVNLLREPKLAELAAEQAIDAELVILALRDGYTFSIPLRAFVNDWLTEHIATQAALIAVFENAGPATDFARRHLENAARRCKLEFLTQTIELSEDPEIEDTAQLFWIM